MSRSTTLENRFYEGYLRYFHTAETTRRWNVNDDIPWADVQQDAPANVRAVAQAYFAVESYVPDYTSKMLQLIRKSRGRHLFQASWGYEESKHGLAIGMWLVRSGTMTEDELIAFEDALYAAEWSLPYEDPLHVLCYTVLQEYATRLNYTRLRAYADKVGYGDPSFDRVFALLARDEAAHFGFFKSGLEVYLELYRDDALAALARVISEFAMPARAEIPGWSEREQLIVDLDIFNARVFVRDVVGPCLKSLHIDRKEMREASRRMMAKNAAAASSTASQIAL